MNPRLRSRLWLAGIVAVGLGLRLWGIGFSASAPTGRPDEEFFSVGALHLFAGSYDRLGTGWPDLFFKLWHAVLWLEHLWFSRRFGATVNMGCLVAVNSHAAFVPIRVVSALLGAATVWIVACIASELVPERAEAVGAWAAAFYALNYLVGRDGHYAVSDALLCFEVAVTLLCCVRVTSRGAWWLVAAAFCAGSAFSTKYSAVGLAFPWAAAAAEVVARERRRAAAPIAVALLAAIAGLLLWSPDIVTHWAEFQRGFGGHFGRYAERGDAPPGFIFYGAIDFPATLGWPGLLLCLVGLGWCLRQRRALPLIVYTVMFYACVLGPLRQTFVRYGSPLVPALAVFGAVASAPLVERLAARLTRTGAIVVVVLLALAVPAARLVAFDRLLAGGDTRDAARDWLLARGEDRVILTRGLYSHVHAVEASVAAVCRQELPAALWRPTPILMAPTSPIPSQPGEFSWTVDARWLPDRLASRPAVAGQGPQGWERIAFLGVQRFLMWESDQLFGFTDLHGADAPDYLASAWGPPAIIWTVGRREPAPIDVRCWTPVARFSPGRWDGARWDLFDAFVVPFTNFAGLERTGPEISIDKNVCKPTSKQSSR